METNQVLAKLCVDAINSPQEVAHFSKNKSVDQAIREGFYKIMGVEKNPTLKDIRRHQVAMFEILEEVLVETYNKGILEDEFFMQFAEIRNVALGDSIEFFVEDDAILTVSEHSGNHWSINRQKLEGGKSFTVETKARAIAVYGDFRLFLTGRLSWAKLVEKVAQAIKVKIYEEVAASFASAVTNLPAEFTASGVYDKEDLIELASHVEAATGTGAIVVGTKKALAKVTAGLPAALYSNEMKNELAQTGRVRHVDGLTLVELPAVHKANTFEFAYDDNQLLVLPQNIDRFIKVLFEGEDMIKEVTDGVTNNDMSTELKFLTTFGVTTVFSSLFGVYTLA